MAITQKRDVPIRGHSDRGDVLAERMRITACPHTRLSANCVMFWVHSESQRCRNEDKLGVFVKPLGTGNGLGLW